MELSKKLQRWSNKWDKPEFSKLNQKNVTTKYEATAETDRCWIRRLIHKKMLTSISSTKQKPLTPSYSNRTYSNMNSSSVVEYHRLPLLAGCFILSPGLHWIDVAKSMRTSSRSLNNSVWPSDFSGYRSGWQVGDIGRAKEQLSEFHTTSSIEWAEFQLILFTFTCYPTWVAMFVDFDSLAQVPCLSFGQTASSEAGRWGLSCCVITSLRRIYRM